MTDDEVLDIFRDCGALLDGHFKLSSGLRSSVYLQCALVLQNPERAATLCRALADQVIAGLGDASIDLVVSPAMGGVVVGYEMGRQLGVDTIFTERVDGELVLRRGFEIPDGARVLMVEDVVTTGLSSRECIATIRAHGGEVVGATALVDRSSGRADLGVTLYSLLTLDAPTYNPDDLPDWLAAIPAIKPGSRGLN